ncbi:hypothetical protein P167DRAFT_156793 [Morchella conica CCBAS932]|uniref:Uncharacterized protein n=1 Tax=Morchella conica CCBAS932 TaxID=1392247 RepID=A0A3N4KPB1_9PEZI|nr:hypothetical protein P167DRAFT_156793 [Morchella conica CCBAS932]
MPSGFGLHGLNQLEGKDDIEDPVDLVKTEGIKTRHHHLAYEGGSNASPTQEETQNFPYHPSATVPSKGAIKIGTPMNSSLKFRKQIPGGLRPVNKLYGNNNGSGSRKRMNPKPSIEFPNDQHHPRKQQKMISAVDQASEDSDEIMEVSPIDGKKKGMQQEELRGLPRSRNISKYCPDDHDLSEEMEVDPKKPEFGKKGLIEPERLHNEKELKGDQGFVNSIFQLPDVLKKGTTSSSRGRWSSRGGESSRGGDNKTPSHMRWTGATSKKSAKPPREQYIGQ